MAIIPERDKAKIQKELSSLGKPVKLLYFTQELECDYCRETGELLRELSELSDKITFETYNFQLDSQAAAQYQIDKIPATVVMGDKDYGIRIYGIPMGYEFANLLDAVKAVSAGDSGLQPDTREKLAAIKEPVHIQVMTTPT